MGLLPNGHPGPAGPKVSSPQNEPFVMAGAIPSTEPAWRTSGPRWLLIVQLHTKCGPVDPSCGVDCKGPRTKPEYMLSVQAGTQMPKQAMTLWNGQCWDTAEEATRGDNPPKGSKAKDLHGS